MRRFRFRRFRDDETGSIPIEGLMGFLLIMGWFLVAFEIYDAFRIRAAATRASYVVADLLSRERNPVGPKYVEGMKRVFDFVAGAQDANQAWMRVTLIKCWDDPNNPGVPCNDGDPNRLVKLVASYATGTADIYTQTALDREAPRIPVLAAGDTATIVETSLQFRPLFGIGERWVKHQNDELGQMGLTSALRFSSFVVTRPRVTLLVWDPNK